MNLYCGYITYDDGHSPDIDVIGCGILDVKYDRLILYYLYGYSYVGRCLILIYHLLSHTILSYLSLFSGLVGLYLLASSWVLYLITILYIGVIWYVVYGVDVKLAGPVTCAYWFSCDYLKLPIFGVLRNCGWSLG